MTVLSSPSWVLTDDSGNGQTGSPLDAAWAAALKADINTLLHSTTNSGISPAQIIDEVVTARGSKASLDARLDVGLNEDGTLIAGAGIPTTASLGNGLGGTNLVMNDDFLIWSSGDAALPDGWTTAGGGGTVARAGTGLGDTSRLIGDYCLKIAAGGGGLTAQQIILNTGAEFNRISNLLNTGLTAWSGVSPYVTAGVWIKTGSPNVLLGLNSGAGGSSFSPAASTGSLWRFVSVRHLLTSVSTVLYLWLIVPPNVTAYWSGPICMFGENLVSAWQPSPKIRGSLNYTHDGNAAFLTDKFRHLFARPARIEDTRLSVRAAPTGASLIVDVNRCETDVPVYATMYTTKPTIAIGAFYSGALVPDGVYTLRCFNGFSPGGSSQINRALTVDIDQVGSGVTGTELSINISYLQYARAIESLLNA